MGILSVDLAYQSWSDIGIVRLAQNADAVICDFIRDHYRPGPPTPREVAGFLTAFCDRANIGLLLLDGPQAWKDPNNGIPHSRVCERLLNTRAKTGLPGHVKPANYTAFVTFAIAVFDELAAVGWERLRSSTPDRGARLALESFPFSAWKALGIPALPAKSKAKPENLETCLARLSQIRTLRVDQPPTHDELQSLVAGLAGIAIEHNLPSSYSVCGVTPVVIDGVCREGFIVSPSRAR
jgi:hypothetical protein